MKNNNIINISGKFSKLQLEILYTSNSVSSMLMSLLDYFVCFKNFPQYVVDMK